MVIVPSYKFVFETLPKARSPPQIQQRHTSPSASLSLLGEHGIVSCGSRPYSGSLRLETKTFKDSVAFSVM